jgi:hypothetical protein
MYKGSFTVDRYEEGVWPAYYNVIVIKVFIIGQG